jgi:hypothetical protein
MARISTYAIDAIPSLGDKVIGTDQNSNLRTQNYTLGEIITLFNKQNKLGVADQSVFLFQDDISAGRDLGTISFSAGGGIGTAFSSITTFLISKSSFGGESRAEYLPLFIGKDIILAQLSNINNFGTYKVQNIVTDVTEPDFFAVTVSNQSANGVLKVSSHYIFSEFTEPNSGGDLNFTYTQASTALVWNITHNLGKNPSVSVADSAGTWVVGQVDYINSNELTITFNAAFQGVAYLN